MNPLNTQQQSTQYFTTSSAGMPPLAPATTAATSILKSSSSMPNNTGFAGINTSTSSSSGNIVMGTTKYVTNSTTHYVPVLLTTNQTFVSNLDPVHQQQTQQEQFQQQQQRITPTIINVSNSPVVTGPVTTSQHMNLIQTTNKTMGMTASNTGNVTTTYQMLPPTNTNIVTASGTTVNVLLASPQTNTMATAGHVAAPIIIRNTPTATTVSATTTTEVGTAAAQFKQKQQQLPTRQQQHLQQQQPKSQQQLHTQNINAEILKHIIVGNPGSTVGTTTNLAPGATLLKPSLLQSKPVIQQQQQQKQLLNQQKHLLQQHQQQQKQKQQQPIVKNKPMISTPPQTQKQQQQQHQPQPVNQQKSNSSSKMFDTLGMELVKSAPVVGHTPNPTNLFAQTVQKLPQVSLLQNSKKSLNNTTTEIINEHPAAVMKNPNEIKVGNLNNEVSLIKKPNVMSEKLKDTSLLKNFLKTQGEKLDSASLKTVKSNKIDHQLELNSKKTNYENLNKTTGISKGNLKTLSTTNAAKDKTDASFLLKSKRDLNNRENSAKSFNENMLDEKQESLLKLNNKKAAETTLITSPRTQRSKSCNTAITTKTAASNNNNSNERRFSEPSQIEKIKNSKTLDLKKSATNKQDKRESEEFYNLLEVFEDEEYLESLADKSETTSKDNMSEIVEKSTDLEIKTQIYQKKNLRGNEEKIEKLKSRKTLENNEQAEINERNKSHKNTIEEKFTEKVENNEIDTNKIEDAEKPFQNTIESDDDVTILPMEEAEIEQIEIDDDDDDADKDHQQIINKSSSTKEKRNESLLCDEQVLISSSSSISNHSSDQISGNSSSIKSPKFETTSTPLLKRTLMEQRRTGLAKGEKPQPSASNGFPSVLEMLSNFNMLHWKERIGSARGTNLKFQLNEFNLLQIYENGQNQERRIHTAYEKPIYEREASLIRSGGNKPPVYYMCRRCNVQGPAVDFLAPGFCSLFCLKRDSRKRQRDDGACILRKRHRYSQQNDGKPNSIFNVNQPPPLTYINPPKFRWSNYLKSNFTSIAAPISLFLNPFPTGPNNFVVGMKLEAIDPENCALFCVCTVVDIMGYRLKLSFDGYDKSYDFWLNADSMDIFPPGWCYRTSRILQPPPNGTFVGRMFNWAQYLSKENALPAPRHLFTHLNSSSLIPRNPFKIGIFLEAEDLNDTGKLCVASVADVLDDRIRIHFDGWDDCYDIIVDVNSPYIHPCGWHEGRQQLVVPPDCENTAFNWTEYIREQDGEAASDEIFNPREPINFKPNMKLEVVDPRNPSLIRPATVVAHKGHRVKLHIDGWPNDYCFWLEDDSPDLHPIGWCDATCHDLEAPPGFQMSKPVMPCPVTGCRGIGNAKKPFMTVHASRDCCPYAAENWRIVMERPPRLGYDNIRRSISKQSKFSVPSSSMQPRLSEQQILDRLQVLDNIKTRNVMLQQDKLSINHQKDFAVANIKKEDTKEIKTSSRITSVNSTSSSSSSTSASRRNRDSDDCSLDVNLDIAKEFLCDYGPRLQQNYTLWQNNFSFDAEKIKRNPIKWTVTEVSVFIDLYLNCRKTATLFNQEDVDGQALLLLQQEDLTDKLGLKLGPAVKLYTCILQLRTLAVTKFDVPYRKSPRK